MELSKRQVINLASAHRALDGTKDTAYKFNHKVRYGFAKNLRILQTGSEDINKVRSSLIREAAPNGKLTADSPEFMEFDRKFTEFLDSVEDVPGIMKVTRGDLELETNPIPVTVLCDLGAIIIDEPPIDSLVAA